MNKRLLLYISIVTIVAILAGVLAYKSGYDKGYDEAQSGNGYQKCVEAGNPVALSNPPQCRDSKGTHYGPSN